MTKIFVELDEEKLRDWSHSKSKNWEHILLYIFGNLVISPLFICNFCPDSFSHYC